MTGADEIADASEVAEATRRHLRACGTCNREGTLCRDGDLMVKEVHRRLQMMGDDMHSRGRVARIMRGA